MALRCLMNPPVYYSVKIQCSTCHQMVSLAFRLYKIQFRRGSARTMLGELTTLPKHPSWLGRRIPPPIPYSPSTPSASNLGAIGTKISQPFNVVAPLPAASYRGPSNGMESLLSAGLLVMTIDHPHFYDVIRVTYPLRASR